MRSRRYRRTRRWTCLSRRDNSLNAAGSNSVAQAKASLHFLDGDAGQVFLETSDGEEIVFLVLQKIRYRELRVVALGTSRFPSQGLEPFLDLRWQSQRKHFVPPLYMYSGRREACQGQSDQSVRTYCVASCFQTTTPQKRSPSGQTGRTCAWWRSVQGGRSHGPILGLTSRICSASSSEARQISSCAL